MKNISHIKLRSAILIISTLLAIFVIRSASAQEKQNQDGEKTIKVKIIKDVDGAKTIIDTVFATDHPIDSKEFKSIMVNVTKQMKETDEAMKEVDREMKNVHYEIALSMADSMLSDSLGKYKMQIITLGDDTDASDNQGAFNYQFDAPLVEKQERVVYLKNAPGKSGSKIIMKRAPGDVKIITSGDSDQIEVEKVVKPAKPD